MRCMYDMVGRKITKNTVIYGAHIRFWPTLYMTVCLVISLPKNTVYIYCIWLWLWLWPTLHTPLAILSRVGQNHIYTPYMTEYLVISLPKIPYIYRIYMVLANPNHAPSLPAQILYVHRPCPIFACSIPLCAETMPHHCLLLSLCAETMPHLCLLDSPMCRDHATSLPA
jgi:hypothetical protein